MDIIRTRAFIVAIVVAAIALIAAFSFLVFTGNVIVTKQSRPDGTPAPEQISPEQVSRSQPEMALEPQELLPNRSLCDDTDEGISPFTKGAVFGVRTYWLFGYPFGKFYQLYDKCESKQLLLEYYCSEDQVYVERLSCPCFNGQCGLPNPRWPEATPFTLQVKGNEECQGKTNTALQLLQEKAPVHYDVALKYLGVIECSDKGSGVFVQEYPPRVLIGKDTRNADAVWYASVIAHESCHARQYLDYLSEQTTDFVPPEVYSGGSAEAQCLDVQYDALEKIGAPKHTLDYVKQVIDTGYWDVPYEDRWW